MSTVDSVVTLPDLVAAQAARAPDRVAVRDGRGAVTYAELVRRVDRFATILIGHGVRPGDVVGVCLDRGAELVVALLAVLRAGAAYLPIDPGHPADRIAYTVADSGASLVLTDTEDGADLGVPRLMVTEVAPDGAVLAVVPGDLAYVIYTSGSTGRPKGVLVRHSAVTALLAAMRDRPGLCAGDVVVATTTVAFDIAVVELFLPLVVGATVVVAPKDVTAVPDRLARVLADSAATVMQATPTAWRLLLESGWRPPAGFRVWCGGELMPPELADLFVAAGAAVWDLYGPTEATVWSACARLGADGRLTEWAPLGDQEVAVLDAALAPAVEGEVYIGGVGLAAGYRGRPSLTAERFLPHPGRPGQRLYRTGDLGRRQPNGRVEMLGRTDHQVKVNGFRIELGEVEAVLARHPAVRAAVVHPRNRRLVAYLVGDGAGPAALRRHLRTTLPEYMVPAVFVWLAELPLNLNGKVDRGALPDPADRRDAEVPYVAPRNAVEEALARACGEVLDVPEVGVHDDFFDLGGDSLHATRLAVAAALTVAAVFEHRTVARLAASLRDTHVAPVLAPVRGRLPLSSGQRGLWFLHQLTSAGDPYVEPMAVRLTGPLDHDALAAALSDIVARHEALRTNYVAADGEPVQRIRPAEPVPLPVRDLPDAHQLPELLANEPWQPFDLSTDLLVRALLVRLAPDDHALVVTFHHIACDGLSLHVFTRELAALYTARRDGRPAPPPPAVRYVDHAAWQETWLAGDEAAGQLAHWERRLAGSTPPGLPVDRPHPPTPDTRGASLTFTVPAELTARLDRLASDHGVTAYMVFLAAFQALLARYSGQRDIVVGSPAAARGHAELDDVIGLFTNTVVLRTDLSGDPSVGELLARVRATVLDALDNQLLPFDRIVDRLAPNRNRLRNPLFNTLFTFLNEDEPVHLDGLAASRLAVPRQTAKFDLSIDLFRREDRTIAGELEYAVALFDRSTAERLIADYGRLLESFALKPDLDLGAERSPVHEAPAPAHVPAAPGNEEIEARIAAVWAKVLDIEEPTTQDNFFSLGGDSLTVMRAVSKLRRAFAIELTVIDMMTADTLADLASVVASKVDT